MMAKTVPLDDGLIVRKGEAASAAAPTPKGIAGTIAVTLRLDPGRYERLKLHGVRTRQSNQQILVDALDAYLSAGR